MSSDSQQTADEPATTINGIGDARAAKLDVETVAGLAATTLDEAFDSIDSSAGQEDVKEAIHEAREALGVNKHNVPSLSVVGVGDSDDGDRVDDIVSGTMGVDELIDAVDENEPDRLQPDECETIAIVAGGLDVPEQFDKANPSQDIASAVHRRLMGAGVAGNFEKAVFAGDLSGYSDGQIAFTHWAVYTQQETSNEAQLPSEVETIAPKPHAVGADSFSDVEDDEWSDVFGDMKERVIDEADMVLGLAPEGYIGDWVSRVSDRDQSDVIIDAPRSEDQDDEETSQDDVQEAMSEVVTSGGDDGADGDEDDTEDADDTENEDDSGVDWSDVRG